MKRDKEPYEKDYYHEWLRAIWLLKKAHPVLQSVLNSGFGNYSEGPFQEFLNDIEDII